ncbi:unnamed protein product [Thlaspi arvense]|uniref:Uncharacterized protein n=1 Tax=Thlaspi arvense TaxID=13288 RepID=A0AAU9R4F5_THLAR|nr:unnamed protein product [Thlaspi arvense]
MATKTTHLVDFLLSLLLLLLLISLQVGAAEATNRNQRQRRALVSLLPPRAPIYLPPSKSRRGKGNKLRLDCVPAFPSSSASSCSHVSPAV